MNLLGFVFLVLWLPLCARAESHAFLWSAETGMQDLGTLGGTSSSAAGINNNGEVVGNSALADGTIHPFIWTASSGMVDLGLPRAASFSAVAINSLSHVVGNGADAKGNQFAYLWTPERGFVRVGAAPGGHNVATGLNDFDEVTGTSYTTTGSAQAFLWSPGHPQVRHLGVYPGGSLSQGFAFNNLHHVACFGHTHPLAGPDNAPFFVVLQYAKASGWKILGGIDFGTFPAANNDHDTVVGHTSDTFALDKAVDFINGGIISISLAAALS